MNRAEMEYSLEEDLYFQPITGSQIVRAYGVSTPIQEAPSQEEFTLRQIDSYISNLGANRGDHRHLSQGFSNLSNIINKTQHRSINELNSVITVKKDQSLIGSPQLNRQISLSKQQMILQQLQEEQQQQYQQTVTAHSLAHSTPIPNSELEEQQDNVLELLGSSKLSHNNNNNNNNTNIINNNNSIINNIKPKQSTPSSQFSTLVQQKSQQQLSPRLDIYLDTSKKQLSPEQHPQNQPTTINANLSLNKINSQNQIPMQSQSPSTKDDCSIEMQCPFCAQNIQTSVSFQPNCKTHMIATGLGLVGFLCGLCLIPYFFPKRFQTVLHSCPSCHKQISSKEF